MKDQRQAMAALAGGGRAKGIIAQRRSSNSKQIDGQSPTALRSSAQPQRCKASPFTFCFSLSLGPSLLLRLLLYHSCES